MTRDEAVAGIEKMKAVARNMRRIAANPALPFGERYEAAVRADHADELVDRYREFAK